MNDGCVKGVGMEFLDVVCKVWDNVYVFYLCFKVGVVVCGVLGVVYYGCNVENVVYFEGICVEVGVIVLMVVSGEMCLIEVVVIVDSL